MIAKNLAFVLTAIVTLPLLATSSHAAPAKSRQGVSVLRTFQVAGRVFTGTAKTICVIEGEWADGEYFRYEAWDRCAEMTMRRTSRKEFKNEESYGNEDDPQITDTPLKAEVLELTNGSSSVLLFRDRKGVMREITISD